MTDAVPKAKKIEPPPASEGQRLDLAARRRVLDSLAGRGSSEIAAWVIPGVLCWAYGRHSGYQWLWLWWAAFVAFSLVLLIMRRRFMAAVTEPDAQVVPRWERIFERLSLATGLFWAVPVAVSQSGGTSEFKLFLYLVLCAVLASATTFLAPLPGVFWRFFLAVYVPLLVGIFGAHGQRWYYLLPLLLLYGVVIARHAQGGRRLLEQQIEQERQRQELAERYRAAMELAERRLEEKNRFISTTSHDLRQPLHALGLLVQTTLQRNGDAQLTPLLSDVQACVRSLNFMFNALLDLSRLESDGYEPRPELVDLKALFHDTTTVFGPEAAQRGLQLRVAQPRRRQALVHADPALLRQMVFNLVHNALRYTRRGGVLLALRARGGHWRIEVWDTGVGVAPQEQQRIFAPYFRSDHPGVQEVQGHGLGLAVVARAAQRTGAQLGMASRSGQGSCFWLSLPAVAAPQQGLQAAVVPPHSAMAALPASLAGQCLLVDDDALVSQALESLLQLWGLNVQVAASGAQAHALLDAGLQPDVLLCDQRLGVRESGFAVLEQLLARCPGARGAMVSAELNDPQLLQAQEEGYLVFAKPLEPELLHAALARWLPSSTRKS